MLKTVAKQLYDIISLKKEINKIKKWTQLFIKERKNYLRIRDEEAEITKIPIQPSGLFKTLRDVLPKNSAVTLDAGTLCLQATDMLKLFGGLQAYFTPLDFWG